MKLLIKLFTVLLIVFTMNCCYGNTIHNKGGINEVSLNEGKSKTNEDEYVVFKKNNLIGVFIFTISLIGCISVISYRFAKRNNKSDNKALINLAARRSSNEKIIIENLKETILLKDRELMSFSIELMNKEEALKDLVKKIDNKSNLKEIKATIEQGLKNKDYWKQFSTRFSQISPDFYRNIQKKFPMLNSNDMNFCSLLKMKLSNKEIAELLQISHESVISKKYRLKKKMEISDDAEFEKIIFSS